MESQTVTMKSTQNMTVFCVLLAVFVVPTSVSGTGIALPSIGADLRSNTALLQWVVNAFNLTFACFTLAWGGVADVFGSKKSFVAGASLYFIASVVSWAAQNIYVLDIARALAGIGGAAIFSCGSAIFIKEFSGSQRTKAFALFGTTAGLGLTFGPTLSGWLLSIAGWREVFVVHALALFIVLLCSYSVPADRKDIQRQKLDVVGIILFIVSLFCLMFAMTQGAESGWGSQNTLGLLLAGLIIMAFFLIVEKRSQNPMMNIALLSNKRFLGMILIPVVTSFAFVTLLTYFPTYLTAVSHIKPLHAGLIMIGLTLPVLIFPVIAGKMVSNGYSADVLLRFSLLLYLLGLALLWVFSGHPDNMVEIILSLFVIGMGTGLSVGLVDGIALSLVDEKEVGRAAGVLNTFRLGSEAIAVAIYGSLLSSGIYHALTGFSFHGIPDGISSKQFTDDVISGNIIYYVNEYILAKMTDIYKHAFDNVILVLFAISVIISLTIIRLIGKKRAGNI